MRGKDYTVVLVVLSLLVAALILLSGGNIVKQHKACFPYKVSWVSHNKVLCSNGHWKHWR